VLGDILRAVDSVDLAVLMLLDLFDIVDHATLLHLLDITYFLGGVLIN